jgi:hypothetical protein
MTGRNERRIYVGKVYHGRVEDLHRAAVIRAHIQERRLEFIARFKTRAEAESISTGAVSVEATV